MLDLLWKSLHNGKNLSIVTHWGKTPLFIQKFPRIWCLKYVNFVNNEISERWILWKMRFQNCEFCEKWDFRSVNFVKNEMSEMWILWKMRLQKGEFCKNCEFQYVNFFGQKVLFLPQCVTFPTVENWRLLLRCAALQVAARLRTQLIFGGEKLMCRSACRFLLRSARLINTVTGPQLTSSPKLSGTIRTPRNQSNLTLNLQY